MYFHNIQVDCLKKYAVAKIQFFLDYGLLAEVCWQLGAESPAFLRSVVVRMSHRMGGGLEEQSGGKNVFSATLFFFPGTFPASFRGRPVGGARSGMAQALRPAA
jgi:hypothetical protein